MGALTLLHRFDMALDFGDGMYAVRRRLRCIGVFCCGT